mmetsp:Transcript_11449/g.33750  ORF Transcript_11449/g.33750 Transcript_11449/m.33750 type:complete len:300 (+) Transcript_11449:1603-2502(+)
MRLTMPDTIDLLNSNPPSSRRKLDRKPMMTRCLEGYVRHSCWRDRTTVILYSSAISVRKVEICLSRRSMEFSDPVLRRVVMARVAMERLESAISASRSSLHLDTVRGWACATCARVFMEANRMDGLGLDRNICSTEMAGLRSCGSTCGKPHMSLAASYDTISVLCLSDDSRNWYPDSHMGEACWIDPACARPSVTSSCISLVVYLIRRTIAMGLFKELRWLNCWTILLMPNRSWALIWYKSCMAWNWTISLALDVASVHSEIHRFTMEAFSGAASKRCKADTRAADETMPEESTTACFT